MPTSDQELIPRILASPDEDGPRLEGADRHARDGDADRAELIRLQCDQAKRPRRDRDWFAVREREKRLLEQHAVRWGEELTGLGVGRYEFRRGFVEHLEIPQVSFLANTKALAALAPVRSLRLTDVTDDLVPYLQSAPVEFANLRHLDLSSSILGKGLLQALGNCRTLSSLHGLNLAGTGVGADGLGQVIASPLFDKLVELDLSGNCLEECDWKAFAARFASGRLEKLSLRGTVPYVRPLARSGVLARLTDLDLGDNEASFEDDGVEWLVAHAGFTRLAALRLKNNCLTEKGIERLAEAPWAGALRLLNLAENRLGPEGVALIGRVLAAGQVTDLDLSGTHLGDHAVAPLVQCPGIESLASLRLGYNFLTDAAAVHLAEARSLAGLLSLDLAYNLLTDAGVTALLSSPHQNLAHLVLTGNLEVNPSSFPPGTGVSIEC